MEPAAQSRAIRGKCVWECRVLNAISDPERFAEIVRRLAEPFRNQNINRVVAFEALGFPFGAGVALALNAGLVLVRKTSVGQDTPEFEAEPIHDYSDAPKAFKILKTTVSATSRVLIVDDYLETGGQLRSAFDLLKRLGATIHGAAFISRASYPELNLSFFTGCLHDLGSEAHKLVPIVEPQTTTR